MSRKNDLQWVENLLIEWALSREQGYQSSLGWSGKSSEQGALEGSSRISESIVPGYRYVETITLCNKAVLHIEEIRPKIRRLIKYRYELPITKPKPNINELKIRQLIYMANERVSERTWDNRSNEAKKMIADYFRRNKSADK